jgi:hypothetical protein
LAVRQEIGRKKSFPKLPEAKKLLKLMVHNACDKVGKNAETLGVSHLIFIQRKFYET